MPRRRREVSVAPDYAVAQDNAVGNQLANRGTQLTIAIVPASP